jgi:hypothetical protein
MLGKPVSANAGGDAAFGSARHWPARAKPADRLVKQQRPGRPTRLKPPHEPAL